MGLIYVPLFLIMLFGARSQETDYVTGVQGEDVILPCLCGTGELEKLKWQTVKPERLIYKMNQSEQNDLNGVETYWRKNSSDCSLGLKNVIVADSNTYKCIFQRKLDERYLYKKIILQVLTPTDFTEVFPPPDFKEVFPASAQPVVRPSERLGTFLHPSKKIFVIPIAAFLLIVGCLCNAYLKRRRNQQLQTNEVAEDFSEVV